MEFKLMNVSGYADAAMALKMSKRHYSVIGHEKMIQLFHDVTDQHGFFPAMNLMNRNERELYEAALEQLNIIAKYGAGIGGEAWLDDGHDTLLRFIDLTFMTIGLHRAAQDDLDAHAKRFDNRIVRESTRLGVFSEHEKSDWYADKTRSFMEMMEDRQISYPTRYTDKDGIEWKLSTGGYIRADFATGYYPDAPLKDVMRGNYQESIPSNAIWKINLCELRHVYKRRNIFTHASPELKAGIEQLADQIEVAIPGDLGMLVRHDWARTGTSLDGQPQYDLVHVMDIEKAFCARNLQEE